jgi:WXG100 protein secretion system (Wss), protein YukD
MPKKALLDPPLLITLCGPEKTLDLELPGDAPVGELLPLLLELCGGQTGSFRSSSFHLYVSGSHMPLTNESTLLDARIQDSAVLLLQTSARPSKPPETDRFTPKAVLPAKETGGIGITWANLD